VVGYATDEVAGHSKTFELVLKPTRERLVAMAVTQEGEVVL
jgi:hypothetical protein